ncbi:hypothetical protein NY2A_b409R [Paramecium bursaria Chlorella virus NY2A]|uniref:Uncharacterized protein b409R n=1 Tax=Paramecium bursaria Chlorella virus NY2A TaxID=46021 RepID=A7IWT4_PBCVN|nr:hypothetical protein NY2A_b409R [Paramecium bursaria Chlorella virus NY2A]ABT14808.1 hypothetical protein NY2A_b409R [Paramecium bursaria Chlorella virus NY2A]
MSRIRRHSVSRQNSTHIREDVLPIMRSGRVSSSSEEERRARVLLFPRKARHRCDSERISHRLQMRRHKQVPRVHRWHHHHSERRGVSGSRRECTQTLRVRMRQGSDASCEHRIAPRVSETSHLVDPRESYDR